MTAPGWWADEVALVAERSGVSEEKLAAALPAIGGATKPAEWRPEWLAPADVRDLERIFERAAVAIGRAGEQGDAVTARAHLVGLVVASELLGAPAVAWWAMAHAETEALEERAPRIARTLHAAAQAIRACATLDVATIELETIERGFAREEAEATEPSPRTVESAVAVEAVESAVEDIAPVAPVEAVESAVEDIAPVAPVEAVESAAEDVAPVEPVVAESTVEAPAPLEENIDRPATAIALEPEPEPEPEPDPAKFMEPLRVVASPSTLPAPTVEPASAARRPNGKAWETVREPRPERAPARMPERRAAAEREPTPMPRARRPRVLIADDSMLAARFLERMLAARGAEVEVAHDAAAARGALAAREFDVMFWDRDLPGLGGAELMRSHPECRDRVVLLVDEGEPRARGVPARILRRPAAEEELDALAIPALRGVEARALTTG